MSLSIRSRIILLAVCACCVLFVGMYMHAQQQEITLDVLSCEVLAKPQQIECVVDAVVAVAKTTGIEEASAMVADAIQELPALENECHSIMHVLGEEAYELYKDGVSLDITQRSTMCTYGFYHGFITATVLTEGSFDSAQEFCAYVNEALKAEGLDSQSECYHGFGHAVVDDHVSTELLTATEVVDIALGLCADLSQEPAQFNNCAGGVFNAVANIFADATYSWPEIQQTNGGLELCGTQEPAIRTTCYGYFARVILAEHAYDLSAALASAGMLVEKEYVKGLVENISAMYMVGEEDKSSMESHIETCRQMPEDTVRECIAGLAVGVIQSVDPDNFDESLTSVCAYTTLTEEEQRMCYDRVLINVAHLITRDALTKYCGDIPPSMRNNSCS